MKLKILSLFFLLEFCGANSQAVTVTGDCILEYHDVGDKAFELVVEVEPRVPPSLVDSASGDVVKGKLVAQQRFRFEKISKKGLWFLECKNCCDMSIDRSGKIDKKPILDPVSGSEIANNPNTIQNGTKLR